MRETIIITETKSTFLYENLGLTKERANELIMKYSKYSEKIQEAWDKKENPSMVETIKYFSEICNTLNEFAFLTMQCVGLDARMGLFSKADKLPFLIQHSLLIR